MSGLGSGSGSARHPHVQLTLTPYQELMRKEMYSVTMNLFYLCPVLIPCSHIRFYFGYLCVRVRHIPKNETESIFPESS